MDDELRAEVEEEEMEEEVDTDGLGWLCVPCRTGICSTHGLPAYAWVVACMQDANTSFLASVQHGASEIVRFYAARLGIYLVWLLDGTGGP